MNKIREIDLDGDGLHFVTKAGDNLWIYVDAEDRIAVIGLSPEDAIVKFRNSVYNDGLEPGDVRINLILFMTTTCHQFYVNPNEFLFHSTYV